VQNRRLWMRLCEKGGKRHEMPCHHNLETYLHAYLDGGGISADSKGPLFRTIGRTTGQLTSTPLPPAKRPRYDPPARSRRRHHNAGRQSHLPGDRHHGVSQKRRIARKRRRDGEPRLDPHHAALRSPARRSQPRRGGADFDLSAWVRNLTRGSGHKRPPRNNAPEGFLRGRFCRLARGSAFGPMPVLQCRRFKPKTPLLLHRSTRSLQPAMRRATRDSRPEQ
jgi:hypothetical protein